MGSERRGRSAAGWIPGTQDQAMPAATLLPITTQRPLLLGFEAGPPQDAALRISHIKHVIGRRADGLREIDRLLGDWRS